MQLKAKAKAKAKTCKEMAAGWKKTRDEPVPDDHAEGEDEEPKEEDATVADDEHRSYPKVRKCARMIKSGQVPEDLQQLYEEGSKNSPPPRNLRANSSTKSFSRTPVVSLLLLLEIPSARFSRRTLRFAPTNLRLLGCLTPSCRGKIPVKPASFEWAERRGDVYQKDGYYHVRTIATAIEKKQGNSMVLHGGQANITKDELFADESIHVEQALEPAWHWRYVIQHQSYNEVTPSIHSVFESSVRTSIKV